ncbi:MAG TPA: hypothetical protein VFL61_01560 [Gaiellaceae bacterium]|nr:hypothetical protein [Gaiellaceae bacterium]
MEPRISLSAYATVLGLGLALTSLVGHPMLAALVSIGLLVSGAVLHVFVYARRRQRDPLAHRVRDDRRVVAQWTAAALVGLASAVATWFAPALTFTQREVVFFAVGAVIFFSAVYGSALIDWYYITPSLAGLVGSAPCETARNGRWVGLTNIWYFHRLVATVLASGTLIAVPGMLASTADSDTAQGAWTLLSIGVATIVLATNRDYASVVTFLKNPRLSVGDVVLLIREAWGGDPQRVYVADVAVEGAKVKRLDGDDFAGAPFAHKEDTTMLNDEVARCVKDPKERPICRDGNCSGVNWYCRNNPLSAARAARARR